MDDRRNPSESEFLTEVATREEQKLLSHLVQTKVAHPSVPSALLAKDPSGDPVEVKTTPRCLGGSSAGFPSPFHGAGVELVVGNPMGWKDSHPWRGCKCPLPLLGCVCCALLLSGLH